MEALVDVLQVLPAAQSLLVDCQEVLGSKGQTAHIHYPRFCLICQFNSGPQSKLGSLLRQVAHGKRPAQVEGLSLGVIVKGLLCINSKSDFGGTAAHRLVVIFMISVLDPR